MRFEGKINEHSVIDYSAYYRDRVRFRTQIILLTDYLNRILFCAEVYGHFGEVCVGVNPLHIEENEEFSESMAEIEISGLLFDRLVHDGETQVRYLDTLRRVILYPKRFSLTD